MAKPQPVDHESCYKCWAADRTWYHPRNTNPPESRDKELELHWGWAWLCHL